MHRKIILVLSFLVYSIALLAIVGQGQMTFANTSLLTISEENKIFLPIIYNGSVAYQSPFWVQIAALHQIPPGGMLAEPIMSESEWAAYLADVFPTLIEALVESGAGGTRIYLKWSEIEPSAPIDEQPQYTWSWYDERLRQITEAGVETIVTIADAPDWAADPPCSPIYPDRLIEFTRFLTDLVNRYKLPPYNIKYWELVNEPDYTWPNGWAGGLGCWGNDGDKYATMLSVAYPAIKAADPDAVVLQGGVAHDWFIEYGGPFYRYFPDEVMQAGGGAYFDVLNFHYFPDFHGEWERWDPNSPDRQNGWLPAPTCDDLFDGLGPTYEAGGIDLVAKASHYRNRMVTCFGLDKPVWVTELAEHGYPNNPDSLANQARYIIQGNVRGLAAGVGKIVWYALVTPNDSYEQGLLYDDFSPKPAFYAYKTIVAELTNFRYKQTLPIAEGEAYVFQNSCQSEKTVAWGNNTPLTFSPATSLRVVDYLGNMSIVQDGGTGDGDGAQNGSVTFQLSINPVIIQVLP